jgi:hypothetical protein
MTNIDIFKEIDNSINVDDTEKMFEILFCNNRIVKKKDININTLFNKKGFKNYDAIVNIRDNKGNPTNVIVTDIGEFPTPKLLSTAWYAELTYGRIKENYIFDGIVLPNHMRSIILENPIIFESKKSKL